MRNPNRFDFKCFSVNQSRSVMKVCTDSCVFGALADIEQSTRILDIGTGTGLLSLMLAQKAQHEVHIDAIDLDAETLHDAIENIDASPWNTCIEVHHENVMHWNKEAVYDMIICNPPFHVRSTTSKHREEAIAFHSDLALPFDELIRVLHKKSHETTSSWILLPFKETTTFISLAQSSGLFVKKSIIVRDTIKSDPIRRICVFSKQELGGFEEMHFAYREYVGGPFTQEFVETLSPFYLFL